jgi:D-alanyl-D-alanine dipeptidase
MVKTLLSLGAVAALALAPNATAVPTVGMGGLVPNAYNLAQYVMANYPGVLSIGGVRADYLPDHPSGRAIDIMVGGNTGLGNSIASDIQSQSANFGVSYILWQTANHYDHIHVTVN